MKRILYVEDSITSQGLMRRFLKGLCDLVATPSPALAGELLKTEQFDAIITDFFFTDSDALDLMRGIRRSHDVHQVPIIVVSSSMDRALATRMIAAGANECVAKPLHPEEFRRLVERMLEQPYVRTIERSVSRVCCLQWDTDEAVFQFCPDLGLVVSAPTKEDVAQRMHAALCERRARGTALGGAAHETIVTHLVEH